MIDVIIIIAAVLLASVYIISVIKKFRGKSCCSGNCRGCSCACSKNKAK